MEQKLWNGNLGEYRFPQAAERDAKYLINGVQLNLCSNTSEWYTEWEGKSLDALIMFLVTYMQAVYSMPSSMILKELFLNIDSNNRQAVLEELQNLAPMEKKNNEI